MDNLIVI